MAPGNILDFNQFASPSTSDAPFGTSAPQSDPFAYSGSTDDDSGIGVLDLSGVDPNAQIARTIFDPAIYNAIVDDLQYKKSKAGKPMLQVTWKVFHPADAGKTIKVWSYFILEKDFLPNLVRFLKIIGSEIELSAFNPSTCAPFIIGKQARLKLKVAQYQGKPKNEIDGDSGILLPANAVAWA